MCKDEEKQASEFDEAPLRWWHLQTIIDWLHVQSVNLRFRIFVAERYFNASHALIQRGEGEGGLGFVVDENRVTTVGLAAIGLPEVTVPVDEPEGEVLETAKIILTIAAATAIRSRRRLTRVKRLRIGRKRLFLAPTMLEVRDANWKPPVAPVPLDIGTLEDDG